MIIKNKRAFTIVEVSVAAILFVVVCGAVYKIFSGVSTGFQRSTKSLNMQNEMRNGLTYMREEMQRASYRSEVKINGTGVKEDGFEFKISKEPTIDPMAASGKTIAKWYICKPFNKSTNTGCVFEATLSCKEGEIIYNRVYKPGEEKGSAENEGEVKDKVLMKGIGKLNIDLEENAGTMVNVEVFGYDKTHSQPDLNTTAQTGAKVEVKVKKEL